MNFELGKSYIVDVTEKGIIPLMEFDNSRWYHKDYDELDFLTDEEKIVVINKVLGEIRAEIDGQLNFEPNNRSEEEYQYGLTVALDIINKHKAESEVGNELNAGPEEKN